MPPADTLSAPAGTQAGAPSTANTTASDAPSRDSASTRGGSAATPASKDGGASASDQSGAESRTAPRTEEERALAYGREHVARVKGAQATTQAPKADGKPSSPSSGARPEAGGAEQAKNPKGEEGKAGAAASSTPPPEGEEADDTPEARSKLAQRADELAQAKATIRRYCGADFDPSGLSNEKVLALSASLKRQHDGFRQALGTRGRAPNPGASPQDQGQPGSPEAAGNRPYPSTGKAQAKPGDRQPTRSQTEATADAGDDELEEALRLMEPESAAKLRARLEGSNTKAQELAQREAELADRVAVQDFVIHASALSADFPALATDAGRQRLATYMGSKQIFKEVLYEGTDAEKREAVSDAAKVVFHEEIREQSRQSLKDGYSKQASGSTSGNAARTTGIRTSPPTAQEIKDHAVKLATTPGMTKELAAEEMRKLFGSGV